ncbi:hypothetical protein SEA_RUBEUS_71 [Mycobacterium phage Rubeus]|nr:hypothetical protein SEA_RUBEUS_71 [Mycobacterium phage Rubeus]
MTNTHDDVVYRDQTPRTGPISLARQLAAISRSVRSSTILPLNAHCRFEYPKGTRPSGAFLTRQPYGRRKPNAPSLTGTALPAFQGRTETQKSVERG